MPKDDISSAAPKRRTFSDDEILSIYRQNPSSRKVAEITGYNQRTVRERLAKIRLKLGFDSLPDEHRSEKFDRLLQSIQPSMPGGSLKSAKVTVYGNAAFDHKKGEWKEHGLDATSAEYHFERPALVVQPHTSPVKAYKPTGITDPSVERIFIIGDQQRGWWCVFPVDNPTTPQWIPFHDERAIDVEMKALSIFRPDRVVVVGDFFDFPQLSRFQQEPQWAQTLQQTIQDGHDYFGLLRETVGPDCKIDFIPGNHETRMTRSIVNNNPALYNLTKPGEKHSVYSVPSLMDFEKRGIECAGEYPSGAVWLASKRGSIPGLVVTHADPKRKEMRADTIHGHLLLPSMESRLVEYEDGPVIYKRFCVSGTGNYSDTSDKVRLTRTNAPSGRSGLSMVQTFLTVEIDRESGMRDVRHHFIENGAARFMGKTLTSSIERKEV